MIIKKTESANLENKRTIFLETGMIIALVIVFYAFNWKSYDKVDFGDYHRYSDMTPDDIVQVTVQKPPEPQMKKPNVIHTINIVDFEPETEEDLVFNAEIDPMDTMPVYVSKPALATEDNIAEEEIFNVVESMPAFPGGEAAMRAFLGKHLKYPEMAKQVGISGKVYVTFVVEKDGSITDVSLLRGIGGGCDEEAIRVVSMMPKWKPGLQRTHAVRVQFVLDIKFTLQGL